MCAAPRKFIGGAALPLRVAPQRVGGRHLAKGAPTMCSGIPIVPWPRRLAQARHARGARLQNLFPTTISHSQAQLSARRWAAAPVLSAPAISNRSTDWAAEPADRDAALWSASRPG